MYMHYVPGGVVDSVHDGSECMRAMERTIQLQPLWCPKCSIPSMLLILAPAAIPPEAAAATVTRRIVVHRRIRASV